MLGPGPYDRMVNALSEVHQMKLYQGRPEPPSIADRTPAERHRIFMQLNKLFLQLTSTRMARYAIPTSHARNTIACASS